MKRRAKRVRNKAIVTAAVIVGVLVAAALVLSYARPARLDVKTVPSPYNRIIESSKKLVDDSMVFISPDYNKENQPPLIRDLFNIKGICSMIIFPREIHIRSGELFLWSEMLPEIKGVVMSHLKGEPYHRQCSDTKITCCSLPMMLVVEEGPSSYMISVHSSELVSRTIEWFPKPDESQPPMVREIFQIGGIETIYLFPYEVRIGKKEASTWGELVPSIKRIIRKHVESGWDQNSIVDHLKARGLASDFESRRELWNRIGRDERYLGTASQNIFLRHCIMEDPVMVCQHMRAISSIKKFYEPLGIGIGTSINFSY